VIGRHQLHDKDWLEAALAKVMRAQSREFAAGSPGFNDLPAVAPLLPVSGGAWSGPNPLLPELTEGDVPESVRAELRQEQP
jgi:hypothetical protein